jgi:hypothetical protein
METITALGFRIPVRTRDLARTRPYETIVGGKIGLDSAKNVGGGDGLFHDDCLVYVYVIDGSGFDELVIAIKLIGDVGLDSILAHIGDLGSISMAIPALDDQSATMSRGAGATISRCTGAIFSRGAGAIISRGAGTTISRDTGATTSRGAGTTISRDTGTTMSRDTGATTSRGAGTTISRGAGATISRGAGAPISRDSYAIAENHMMRKHALAGGMLLFDQVGGAQSVATIDHGSPRKLDLIVVDLDQLGSADSDNHPECVRFRRQERIISLAHGETMQAITALGFRIPVRTRDRTRTRPHETIVGGKIRLDSAKNVGSGDDLFHDDCLVYVYVIDGSGFDELVIAIQTIGDIGLDAVLAHIGDLGSISDAIPPLDD